jgi:hypothetical protein
MVDALPSLLESCSWIRQIACAADPIDAVVCLRSALDLCSTNQALALGRARIARECMWKALHTGDWREATDTSRGLYGAAATLEACLEAVAGNVRGAIRSIDIALMIVAGDLRPRLAALLGVLESTVGKASLSTSLLLHPAFCAAWHGWHCVNDASKQSPADATARCNISSSSHSRILPDFEALAEFQGTGLATPARASTLPIPSPSPGHSGCKFSRASDLADFPLLGADPARNGSIHRLSFPPVQTFFTEHFLPRRPVVVDHATTCWPAHQRWADPHYLLRLAGHRTVPVELGTDYRASGWSQVTMTLHEFMGRMAELPTSPRTSSLRTTKGDAPSSIPHGTGAATSSEGLQLPYLAQHALFDLIPALQADIIVPDYCGLSGPISETGGGEHRDGSDDCDDGEVLAQAWIGPARTVSCLHYDRPHNLLTQVIGYKYVRMFDPQQAARLYPMPGAMKNTSAVNVACPDLTVHPAFAGAPFLDTVLGPGEMLYIPPGWWHYVEALTPSWSVSFWWGAHV